MIGQLVNCMMVADGHVPHKVLVDNGECVSDYELDLQYKSTDNLHPAYGFN